MRIGSLTVFPSPALALAPMAGYSDVALRELVAQNGADITYTELVSASAIARGGIGFSKDGKAGRTARLIRIGAHGISAIQLFGSREAEISAAVRLIWQQVQTDECGAKMIDLNFGCPARKVVGGGAGSKLLENPKTAKAIARAAVEASELPVSVKMRLGYKDQNGLEVARALEEAGVAALAVHGRTAEQKFSGKADWDAIGDVVRAVDVPVFGNGDVRSPPDVKKICEQSGCQGVMAGRAVLADPYFFAHAREYLQKGKWKETQWEEKEEFLAKYITLSHENEIPFNCARQLALQLACGFEGGARMRERITRSKNDDELMDAMNRRLG